MEQNKRFASDWDLTIDPEFRDLLHKQTPAEAALFRVSMLQEGCTEPIIVWAHDGKRIIVDGHHRYEFCVKHDMPFAIEEREFKDRVAVKEWIILRQLARRNLPMHEHARFALAYKPILEAKAEPNLHLSQGRGVKGLQNSVKVNTQKELAKLAGVSGDTIDKVKKIEAEAPKPIVDAARAGAITVNAAYQVTKMDAEQQQEVIKNIDAGSTAKEAVQEVLKQRKTNTRGWTKEDRENRAKTLEIIETMKSNEGCEYTLDMLVEDIQINSTAYFDTLNEILEQHNDLINYDSKPQVCGAIERFVVNAANELRRKIA